MNQQLQLTIDVTGDDVDVDVAVDVGIDMKVAVDDGVTTFPVRLYRQNSCRQTVSLDHVTLCFQASCTYMPMLGG